MANWRDKNQNRVQVIGAGNAPQVTGITAAITTGLTLGNGDTSIAIPAGSLAVGDAIRMKGIYNGVVVDTTWNLLIYANSYTGNHVYRHGMDVRANRVTEFDVVVAVTSATELTGMVHNPIFSGATLPTTAPQVTTINDISTDNSLIFVLEAGVNSGSNTFDLFHYQVEIIKGF